MIALILHCSERYFSIWLNLLYDYNINLKFLIKKVDDEQKLEKSNTFIKYRKKIINTLLIFGKDSKGHIDSYLKLYF